MHKKRISIIGVGLMGGSLGLAIRRRRSSYHVVGVGRSLGRLKNARRLGACDEITTDIYGGVRRSDVVVIGTPVDNIVPVFEKILPFLDGKTVVTDIGSVKASIIHDVQKVFKSQCGRLKGLPSFVGAHPLAGSEKSGNEYAQADLYRGAMVVLCPMPGATSGPSLKVIKNLWESIGARTMVMKPEIHDHIVAGTSHLPHLLAGALVKLVWDLNLKNPNTSKLLAGSFKDMTRISDSDPRQWAEISRANKKFLIPALKSYRKILDEILRNVESSPDSLSKWEEFFSGAQERRPWLIKGCS